MAELQAELYQQLQEQVDSLADVEIALQANVDNEELLQLKHQLEEGITLLRDSLLELQQHAQQAPNGEDDGDELHSENENGRAPAVCPSWVHPGVLCRFRYTDGQWYHGRVDQAQQQGQQTAIMVRFAHPIR